MMFEETKHMRTAVSLGREEDRCRCVPKIRKISKISLILVRISIQISSPFLSFELKTGFEPKYWKCAKGNLTSRNSLMILQQLYMVFHDLYCT
jgi:hypothetical protein